MHYNPYPDLSSPSPRGGLPVTGPEPEWLRREAAHRRRLQELDTERKLARLARSSAAPEGLVAQLRRVMGLA